MSGQRVFAIVQAAVGILLMAGALAAAYFSGAADSHGESTAVLLWASAGCAAGLALLAANVGWRIIRPALYILENTDTPGAARTALPHFPALWAPALERLAELERTNVIFQAFFHNAPAVMFVHDRDDRLVMTNRAGAEKFGLTPEEMAGRPMSDFRHPEVERKASELSQHILETGQSMRIEMPVPTPDGTRWDLVTAFPIRSPGGSIDLLGAIGIDITDMVAANAERDELRRLFDAFMREAPVNMYLKRATGEMVFISGLITQMFGATNEDVAGRQEADLIPLFTDWGDEAIVALRQMDEAILTNRKPISMEGVHPGTGRFELVRRFPIFDDDGNITHIGGVQLDIDDLMKAKDEIAKAQEALYQSEKLAALGQLLAGVSHELNNPLTVVVGRAAILEEKLNGTPHAAAIVSLREAADRCNRIVKTFLAMARQSAPQRSLVQLNDVVEAALDMVAYGLRSAGIDVTSSLAPDLPEVEADEDQLVQVLTNLFLNAQHALQTQKGARTISIRTYATGKTVRIDVADNGPGVPDAIASRVFEPFFTTKAVNEGTGMGLSMSRGMIEEHGGSLSHHKSPGGGATFRIKLAAATRPAEGPKAAIEPADMRTCAGRVLIVDDEEEIRGLLVECLQNASFECVECADGSKALERLERENFDLILCDIRMPVMDGLELIQRVAERSPAHADRIIFLTGDVLKQGMNRPPEFADRPVIEKPFNPLEVRELAARMVADLGPLERQ